MLTATACSPNVTGLVKYDFLVVIVRWKSMLK